MLLQRDAHGLVWFGLLWKTKLHCTPKVAHDKGQQHSEAAKMIETSGNRTEVETSARGKWKIGKL